MFPARKTRRIKIGSVAIGGGAPVSLQSMTNTNTADAAATLAQIRRVASAGCDIIRCAVYGGGTKRTFKTRKEFSGSLLRQVDETYDFLTLNNGLRSGYDGLRRIDYADYPDAALREALLNAVVHRDYDYSGSIIINVYENRMEFISLGGLVKGLTLADIKGGASQPRNMIIANVFYRLELIESYGTGIQKIMESYAGSGMEPVFAPAPASFVVTLPNRNAVGAEQGTVSSDAVRFDPTLSQEDNVLRLLRVGRSCLFVIATDMQQGQGNDDNQRP